MAYFHTQKFWKQILRLAIGGIGTVSLTGLTLVIDSQSQPTMAQVIEPTPEAPENMEQILQVGIGGTPPFLIDSTNADFQGIVPDIWEKIAFVNGWEYEFIVQTETQAALDAVASGELDILVGPFSITAERLEQVDFTQPFFISGLGVLLPEESPPIWERVRPFFTRTALSSIAVLLICLFLVGNGIWLAERRQNSEEFPSHYLQGIGNGMWFALVTLTTVGYGDRSPKTPAGRLIAGAWMLISLIAVSSLIGGLASAFTLALSKLPEDAIRNPGDLHKARMAVVEGTTGETWAAEYRAKVLKQPHLEEAIALLINKKADGVIFDRPTLEYYLSQNPDLPLRVADFNLNTENMGFVLPYGSPLGVPLDVSIVALEEDGTLSRIAQDWLEAEVTLE